MLRLTPARNVVSPRCQNDEGGAVRHNGFDEATEEIIRAPKSWKT